MSHDDRNEFVMRRARNIVALSKNKEIFSRSTKLLADLGDYDYSYMWTWLGLPIIQLPADILATQEAIWKSKPDVIIETGVARGGSLIFLASILQCYNPDGIVIGVDIDIRAHNRSSIEHHPLSKNIRLIEGDTSSENTLSAIRKCIPSNCKVMVILDSDHSKSHVLSECELLAPLVTEGQYLVVADTILGFMNADTTPKNRSQMLLPGNEPFAALNEYVANNDHFVEDTDITGKLVLSSSPAGYYIRRSND